MIIDSSALLAVLYRGPDAALFEQAIAATRSSRMSVANALKASMVVEGRGGVAAEDELDAFLEAADLSLAPMTAEHIVATRRAWRRFGKGNHPAALNVGDCFAYALAEPTGEPFLFKGDDFAQTDIASARASVEP